MTICSVVLASYQGERFIGEQLDSILAQLTPDDEIIVSDDGSSDGTLEAVRRKGDSRICILENDQRLGYVRNFQRAINRVRGHYIFLADQDDIWLPGKVKALCAALRRKPVAASDAIVVNERLEPLHASYFALRGAKSFSYGAIFIRPRIIGATLACRSDYLAALLPFPDGVPHDFWLSLNAAWDNALEVVREPLILYRRHSGVASPTAMTHGRSLARIVGHRGTLVAAMIGRRFWRRGA